MDSKLRNGLLATGGVITALASGWQIAQGSFVVVGLITAAVAALVACILIRRRLDVLATGILLVGYLVGNRGFAQIGVSNPPLLVGEFTLALATIVILWESARKKTLPIKADALNFVLLVWLTFGFVRLRFDVQTHGAVALRDFSLLYYACFFFFAQAWGREQSLRCWIERSLDIGFLAAPPVFLAFIYWPEFFTTYLSFNGTPIIFIKSDVEGGLLVAGVFWTLRRFIESSNRWWLIAAAINLVGVALSNSRAAHVALAVTALWPLLCRDWRLIRPLGALISAGLIVLVAVSASGSQPWSRTPLFRLYENVASMTDVEGVGAYISEDLGDKPDNNRFRLTWWRAVIDETSQQNPWFGLGFGHDLSAQFARSYYAASREEFSARSPHNFALTVFGRMGICGIALLTLVLIALVARIAKLGRTAAKHNCDREQLTPALGAFAILTSACFGVVLEGPMAASIFWTMLGLANTPDPAKTATNESGSKPIGDTPASYKVTPQQELPEMPVPPRV